MVLDGKCSQEYPANNGVPQGSILDPTLFLLRIRSDQLGFLFCRPARLVFFFQIEIRISQKNTIKYLFEAKIWFMLSLRNNRRNIVFTFSKGG